jgi:small redox-active disulfide protein 2
MTIQVLGSGCPTCARLNEITQRAVNEMGLDTKVEYITGEEGMKKIIELGAMTSPLLVVNGEIAMTGFMPDIEGIKEKIRKHSKKQ